MVKLNTENLKTKEPKKSTPPSTTAGSTLGQKQSEKRGRGRPPVFREPFPTGGAAEYWEWRQTNCLQCTKSEDAIQMDQTASCELEEAFSMCFAGVTSPGLTEGPRVALSVLRRKGDGPQCKEFDEWKPTI